MLSVILGDVDVVDVVDVVVGGGGDVGEVSEVDADVIVLEDRL